MPHAGLADACLILGFTGMLPPSAAWERADAEARQALERDEGLAEAHVSRAYVALFQDWDWATARRELDRAAELGPHTAAVRQWRGVYLAMLGRFEEAGREIAHARQLDPLSVVARTIAGLHAYLSGDHEAETGPRPRLRRPRSPSLPRPLGPRARPAVARKARRRPWPSTARRCGWLPTPRSCSRCSRAASPWPDTRTKRAQVLEAAVKAAPHLSAYQQATVHLALGRTRARARSPGARRRGARSLAGLAEGGSDARAASGSIRACAGCSRACSVGPAKPRAAEHVSPVAIP